MMGNNVQVDYMNNVFLSLDNIVLNDKNQLILKFFNNDNKKYFDSTINKLILNSNENNNKIYVFVKKKNNMFLFNGVYKASGIKFNNDNYPYFKLTKTIPEIKFDDINEISNEYLNIFYKKMSKHQDFNKFSDQTSPITTRKIDISNDKMNSLLYKYNWVINKFISTFDYNYAVAYQKFETKMLLDISNVLNKKYTYIFENKIVKNWALCADIYNNTNNKELLEISYYDSKLSISEQNEILKKTLNKVLLER